MYRILRNPSYWRPISAVQPDDGGALQPVGFEARYRALDDDAHALLMTEVAEKQLPDAEFARRVVMELRGLADEAGLPVPHSAEVMEHMLRQPGLAGALVQEYFESRREVALGNLQRPLAAGPAAALPVTTHH